MRNLARGFTMRKESALPRDDWFAIKNEGDRPKVYIYDEIGFWGTDASDFVKKLADITATDFELHINSPGGEVFDGLAIYNAIKQHSANVHVFVDGLAASAASFIAQAGDTVTMARNAQMMIHDGIAFAYGNEQDMLDTAALLSNISNNIADIYAYRAGKRGFDTTLEEFRALMREEVWYTGKEAVDSGLADSVLDHDEEEAPTNQWDLTFFNHAGRNKAESPLRIQERIRLANRQKESNMAGNQPKATTEPTPAPEPAAPEAPAPEPNEDTPVEAPEPAEPTQAPEATPEPAPVPAQGQPSNSSTPPGVMINGKYVTDFAVINQHLSQLTAAQEEQKVTFRKEFVENLARENKIPATQIDSLVNLVNGTDTSSGLSDEQFAAFQASYESAPASSLFGQYAASNDSHESGAPGSVQMSADARKDRISVLEGIVAMHSRTMPLDQVQKTKSYIELQSLLGNNES